MELYLDLILEEVSAAVRRIDRDEIEILITELMRAERVFADGTGRSRLAVEGFVMRLAQMGLGGFLVGSPMTTAIRQDDLYICCSGSASSASLLQHMKKARECGAFTVLITANPGGAIAQYANRVISMPTPTKVTESGDSRQPMGSLFEQSLEILLDSLVLNLMKEKNITNDDMMGRHSNLE